MTRFAPPDLHQCPACAGYFKRYGFRSLYFDDVPDWSDDKNGNWWAGQSGAVGRCPSCASIVWIDDALALMPAPQEPRHIGPLGRVWNRITGDRSGRLQAEKEWKSLPAGIRQAECFDGLKHAHDYIEALKILPLGAHDREIHLRRNIWWASNDYLRGKRGVMFVALPGVAEHEAHANMQRLLELLEKNPEAQVTRGELLRQMGRFDEAVEVLNAVKPDGYSEIKASKIQRLAKAQVTELTALDHTLPGTRVW